jgi:hypothetical protein
LDVPPFFLCCVTWSTLVGLQTGEEASLGVAMHIIEALVLDDAWERTETFCPQSEVSCHSYRSCRSS